VTSVTTLENVLKYNYVGLNFSGLEIKTGVDGCKNG